MMIQPDGSDRIRLIAPAGFAIKMIPCAKCVKCGHSVYDQYLHLLGK